MWGYVMDVGTRENSHLQRKRSTLDLSSCNIDPNPTSARHSPDLLQQRHESWLGLHAFPRRSVRKPHE